MKGLMHPSTAPHMAAPKMKAPNMKTPSMKMPTMPHVAKAAKAPMTRVHPASHNNVRLPQGIADVKAGDPGVYSPDVGKI